MCCENHAKPVQALTADEARERAQLLAWLADNEEVQRALWAKLQERLPALAGVARPGAAPAPMVFGGTITPSPEPAREPALVAG